MMTSTKKLRSTSTQPARLAELVEFRYRLRRFLNFSEMAAEAEGISVQQYQLLQVVAAAPEERGCSITYIAERMLLRHNSAVELVSRAERSGLVRRVMDEDDLRRSLVEVTEKGDRLLAALVEAHLHEIYTEGPELMRTLQKVIDSLPAMKRNGTR